MSERLSWAGDRYIHSTGCIIYQSPVFKTWRIFFDYLPLPVSFDTPEEAADYLERNNHQDKEQA